MQSFTKEKIFLIGFMGSGKTHWGRLLSSAYQLSFADLDEVIEKEEGRKIADIFDEHGENFFREKEAETLRSFLSRETCIIACGGGTPCFHQNMQWMNENGITIYFKTTPHLLASRLLNEKNHRPVLNNIEDDELENFIQQKLYEREPFYNQAKIILEAEDISVLSLKQKILHHIS